MFVFCGITDLGPSWSSKRRGGGIPRHFAYKRVGHRLSIFVDKSGADGLDSNDYLLTLVFHEQDRSIDRAVTPSGNASQPLLVPAVRTGRPTSCHIGVPRNDESARGRDNTSRSSALAALR